MGSYCTYCGHRCFVVRVVPGGAHRGWTGCLATCRAGIEHDRRELDGFAVGTSLNPTLVCCHSDADGAICAAPRGHDGGHRPWQPAEAVATS
ncbi:MAG TPA: hypothetical protein VFY38_14635 [Pseudonocardia sp.]|nr:hypothetical protein [Pseudonocardia sp.]